MSANGGSEDTRQPETKETNMERVVSRDEWIVARKALLTQEKELTRIRDQLSAERRSLPWVEVDKEYVFDAPGGRQTLPGLFGDRSQLIIYHFMFAPEWDEGCPSCSLVADHIDGALAHLAARDVTLLAVSRAPLARIEAFKKRMGWRFKWVSSHGNDFNYDFHVTTDEAIAPVEYNYRDKKTLEQLGQTYHAKGEQPGASAFLRNGDRVYHTYSTYGRGLDLLVGTYNYLDLAPKGRDEDALGFTMEWVRHHDRYGDGHAIGAAVQNASPKEPDSCCA
jgi:predicted dithiol-disulfide oxidoreductase (DUF899 family)